MNTALRKAFFYLTCFFGSLHNVLAIEIGNKITLLNINRDEMSKRMSLQKTNVDQASDHYHKDVNLPEPNRITPSLTRLKATVLSTMTNISHTIKNTLDEAKGKKSLAETVTTFLNGTNWRLLMIKNDALNDENLKPLLDKIKENENAVKNLEELLLETKNLKELPPHCFEGLEKLTILRLSGCQALSNLQVDCFIGLNNLDSLILSGTALKKLIRNRFANLPKLKNLSLSNSENLERFESGCFFGIETLTTLTLSNCPKITTIESEWLDDLTELKTLDLASCTNLEALETNCFFKLKHLEELNIYNTALKEILEGNFNGLLNLKRLRLNNNDQLAKIHPHCFDLLENLTDLDLSMNPKLQNLPNNIFSKLNALQKINLPAQFRNIPNINKRFGIRKEADISYE